MAEKETTFRKGASVTWKASEGEISGKVVEKLTKPTDIKGHHVAASADHPEYLVESSKTGALAAHKPGSLHEDK